MGRPKGKKNKPKTTPYFASLGDYKKQTGRKAYSTKGSDDMYDATGTTYKSCSHTGAIRAFNIQGRHVHGAGSAIRFTPQTDLVIDLANSYGNGARSVGSFIGHATDQDLKDLLVPPPLKPRRLDLNWPDFQAPDIKLIDVAFWNKVWSIMPVVPEGTPTAEAKHTIICCMGSHGRTGTCMAALLISNAGFSMPNAINYVRYNHCTKAVESDTQISYLRELAKQAGTSTQPLDKVMVEKLEALGSTKDADEGSKQGTRVTGYGGSQIWTGHSSGSMTPSKGIVTTYANGKGTAPELADDRVDFEPTELPKGVINNPLTEAEVAAKKAALVTNWPDEMLVRAKFLCVQGKSGLVWASRRAYDEGAYGDKPEVLGVRLV